jgi:hypothetical protein
MKGIASIAFAAAVSLRAAGPLLAQPAAESTIQASKRQWQAAAREFTSLLDQRLEKLTELQKRHAASDQEVDDWREGLALARREQALARNDPAAAREQLLALIEVRERSVTRAASLHQGDTKATSELNAARRRQANAKYQLAVADGRPEEQAAALRSIIELCEQEANRVDRLKAAGAASSTEADFANHRLAYARFRLYWEGGKMKEALAQLRIDIAVRQYLFDRLKKLYDDGYALRSEFSSARSVLLAGKVRLAVLEDKRDAARDGLREMISGLEETLRLIRIRPQFVDEIAIADLKMMIAAEQFRLALVQDMDTPLGELLDNPMYELDS